METLKLAKLERNFKKIIEKEKDEKFNANEISKLYNKKIELMFIFNFYNLLIPIIIGLFDWPILFEFIGIPA